MMMGNVHVHNKQTKRCLASELWIHAYRCVIVVVRCIKKRDGNLVMSVEIG